MTGRHLDAVAAELATLDDDVFRLRTVLHEFGLTWADATAAERPGLVAAEPVPFDLRWDAFLAAYTEHLCYHDGVDPPPWVFEPRRYLPRFWFPGGTKIATLRVEALVHAPAAFEAHGVLLARRELTVV